MFNQEFYLEKKKDVPHSSHLNNAGLLKTLVNTSLSGTQPIGNTCTPEGFLKSKLNSHRTFKRGGQAMVYTTLFNLAFICAHRCGTPVPEHLLLEFNGTVNWLIEDEVINFNYDVVRGCWTAHLSIWAKVSRC